MRCTSKGRTPTATAVICGRTGETLSYRELDEHSAELAARLRGHGVGDEARVGVCMPRTPDLVVALLATLLAALLVLLAGAVLIDLAVAIVVHAITGLGDRWPHRTRVFTAVAVTAG